jgi:glycosyltransferase involved in cell wall biosynthesis
MSKANVDYVLKNNPNISKNKVDLCVNAIEVVSREVADRDVVLQKYDIPSDKVLFLYGGNLGAPQGIAFLLEVLEKIKNRNDLFILIIGSGNKSGLIQKFILESWPSNIKYIDALPRVEYDTIEACCDVGLIFLNNKFTIPNFPSRMLAYMECKLPLLIATDNATDIGKIAENNNFGKACGSLNPDEVIELMDYYINNPDKRQKYGQNGYEFLLNNYSVSHAYNSIMIKALSIT